MVIRFRVTESRATPDGGIQVVLGAITEGQQEVPHSNSNVSLFFPLAHRKAAEPWMLGAGQEIEVKFPEPKAP